MPENYYQYGVYNDPMVSLYPPVYGIMYPTIRMIADGIFTQYGPMYIPTREHFDLMVNNVYDKHENDFKRMYDERSNDRQLWFGRPFLSDLIGIGLIEELLERRRPFFHHHEFNHGFHHHGY